MFDISSSPNSRFLVVAGYFLVPAGLLVATGVTVASIKRRGILRQLRERHNLVITRWIEKQESEKESKRAFNEERGKTDDGTRYRIDVDKAYSLWKTGHDLCCDPNIQKQLAKMIAESFNHELEECVEQLDTDFHYERLLIDIVAKVREMKIDKYIGPDIWKSARSVHTRIRRRHYKQFFRLMFIGSRTRVVSLLVSTGVCAVTSFLEHGSTVAREHLVAAVLDSAMPNATAIVRWAFVDMSFCMFLSLASFATTQAEQFVRVSSQQMWRRLLRNLSRCDTEFFDRHKPEELLSLEELENRLAQAENNLHTVISAAVDVVTRGILFCQNNRRLAIWVATSWLLMDRVKSWLNYVHTMTLSWDLERYEGYDEIINGGYNGANDADADGAVSSYESEAVSMPFETVVPDMKVLRMYGRERELMESAIRQKYGIEQAMNWRDLNRLQELVQNLLPTFNGWVLKILRLWCMWFASMLVREGYVAFDVSQLRVLIDEMWNQLSSAKCSLSLDLVDKYAPDAAVVMHFLEVSPKIEKDGGYVPEDKDFKGEIEFRNVHFAFPTRRDRKILKGLSFTVPAGNTAGLVGHSGCGKSTALLLVQRFYDPDEGEILLDGRDLRDYNVRWLRRKIGVVSQEPRLWDLPIEDNIRFGSPMSSREEVEEAARLANAYEFIMKLPEGFNTRIGRQSVSLSGGEKQRLVIARALLAKPQILLLDEATSALDAVSEGEVQKAMRALSEHCTCISVAHRLGTIKHAQMIVVMKEGRAIEVGTHDELLCSSPLTKSPESGGGAYAELWKTAGDGTQATPVTSGVATPQSGGPGRVSPLTGRPEETISFTSVISNRDKEVHPSMLQRRLQEQEATRAGSYSNLLSVNIPAPHRQSAGPFTSQRHGPVLLGGHPSSVSHSDSPVRHLTVPGAIEATPSLPVGMTVGGISHSMEMVSLQRRLQYLQRVTKSNEDPRLHKAVHDLTESLHEMFGEQNIVPTFPRPIPFGHASHLTRSLTPLTPI